MAETPADAAAIVYAEQLVPNGHGLPLWCPEPTRFGEVLIGDVGHIDSGQFIRLFNATLPANHPVNRAGVPDNFVQLRYDEQTLEHTQHNYLSPGAVYNSKSTSCSVQAGIGVSAPTMTLGGKYSFSCRASRGAIAMLGGPGHRHRVLDNKFFREYISRHHDSWHKPAQARGLMVSAESIILVYGWVKTSNWALAVSSSNATSHDISCEIPSGTCASAIFRVAVSNFSVPAVEQRSGPKDLDGADPPSHTPTTYDQCLFLRYYKRKTRWFLDDVISTRVVAKDARSKEQDTKLAASSSSVHTIEGRKKDNTFARAKQLLATTESASDADVGQLAENPVHQHAALDDQIESIPSIESAGTYDKALDALLGHILANSQACSAIVTHDDLYHLFPDPQQWPTDISASLDTMRPTVLVNDLGVGELSFALGGLEQPLGSPSRHLSSQTEHPTPGNIVTPPAIMLPSPAPYGHSSLASNNVVDDGRHRETSTKSASSPNIGSRQVAFAPTIDFDTLSTSQLSDGDSSAPMQNLQTLPLVIPDLSSLIPQLQLASSAGSHDNQYPYRSSSPNARLSARRQGFATISSPPAATTGSVSHPGQSTQGYLGSQYLHSDQSVTPSIPVRSGHYRRSSSGSREHPMVVQSSGSGAQAGPHAIPQPGYRVPALRISTPTQHHVPEYHMGGPSKDNMEPSMTTIGSAIEAMTVPRVGVTADESQNRRMVPANFPCPIPGCGSVFTRHFNLKMHLRTHAEEKPYQCTWPGCGKGFAREQDCKRHEQLHLSIRPYSCEGCKKNFARMDALNLHLRSEDGAGCRKVQRELQPDGDEAEVGEHESENTAGPSFASPNPQPEPDADWKDDVAM